MSEESWWEGGVEYPPYRYVGKKPAKLYYIKMKSKRKFGFLVKQFNTHTTTDGNYPSIFVGGIGFHKTEEELNIVKDRVINEILLVEKESGSICYRKGDSIVYILESIS